ncbi:hypothetical protein RFI_22618 [Reticulomyxa filosa]|uniref:AAA+ ATPase domain-containing protein n=1 Tax=Reticulomyxa filosa TaxID=46433 RepID=X6MNU2_RETFI|nr:hypothetical protein RFI_22618 [Reticulomyxa filosa]|eukprot:ETO14750.1 hypothetical protein RFI_22618 [Reticulomyxa filosa]
MRFLCERLRAYVESNKRGPIGAIASKISLIYPDITIAQIQANVDSKRNWNWEDKNMLEELGKTLESFGAVTKPSGKSVGDEKTVKYLLPGQPRLYICQDSQILSHVVKLYLSQGQIPIASRVLFCDHSTSIEQLECFLIRSVNHDTATIALHCLVLPELLTRPVQQGLIRILPNYMTKSHSLLAVITTNSQCLVAQTLSAFRDTNPPILDQNESKDFYTTVLCADFDAFRQKKENDAPFVIVYFSQNSCVGKSYVIAQKAKSLNLKDGYFVHVPINTSVVDTDFIVDRLSSAPVTDDLTVFHINISSQAGKDVNTMMFQLLVLRYITKANGESFSVRKNHAFLVELPTQLSSTHVKTRLSDVFNWFYFFGDRIKDLAIPFSEVIDDLRTVPNANPPEHATHNQLALSEKEYFVLKYLDALDKGLLSNSQIRKDWDHTQHPPPVDTQRIKQLLVKYSPKAWNSLVQFKSFLQFMYRQLLQVYNFLYIKNEYVPMTNKNRHVIPLHEMVVFSLVQSAQDIACNSYLINEPTTAIDFREEIKEEKETEKEEEAEESKGIEEFFLVQMWKTADPPIVLLNQTPIAKSIQICMNSLITLQQDLQQAQIEHSLSLLSMNLSKNVHPHAVEWKLVQAQHKWDIYNFEEDFKKKADMVQRDGVYHEKREDQSIKMHLLLQICGGFESPDETKRKQQVKRLLQEHQDYALTFDNLLKIVAIFFRIKSGIPVLIMGETGCGKTKLLKFMASALNINMTSIDVHGGYTAEHLQKDLEKPLKEAQQHKDQTYLIFLDEINTSPEIGAFKEVVCDHSLKGKAFPDNVVIIAALNPFRRRHRTASDIAEDKEEERNVKKYYADDLDKEMCQLVYRVFPLPKSLQTYVWNFGSLSAPDEQQYIAVMTTTTWSQKSFVETARIPIEQEQLKDRSVCSLRDVRRTNMLFSWFFGNREGKGSRLSIVEAIILSLAQCYYYRLNQQQRTAYNQLISKHITTLQGDIEFDHYILNKTKKIYIYIYNKIKIYKDIGDSSRNSKKSSIFRKSICNDGWIGHKDTDNRSGTTWLFEDPCHGDSPKQLVFVKQKQATDRVGIRGLLCHVVSMFKVDNGRFDPKAMGQRGCIPRKLKRTATSGNGNGRECDDEKKASGEMSIKVNRSVVLWLDEVGLAEQSPHRPLKVLHRLLEEEKDRKIGFIGLSNWRLDAAKMNRMVLHQVTQPNDEELLKTAEAIISESSNDSKLNRELSVAVLKITDLYQNIMKDRQTSPFEFDFYGYRDFYSLASSLKYSCTVHNELTNDLLVEAVMRNFGGMTQHQTESFLFPKLARFCYGGALPKSEIIWNKFSPLHLIRNNIEQTRDLQRPDMRNIMLITESPVMWKILFDSGIAAMESTEVIFGSKFSGDMHSTIYLYRTIERVRNAMSNGKLCILLKLEQLYDSLYDVLNQRYQAVDGQKFCRICIGGESIRCRIAKTFRCIVVVPREEAFHECKNSDLHTPVAFLSRFEKFFLDPNLMEQFSFDPLWKLKFDKLQRLVTLRFADYLQFKKQSPFVGFVERYTYISLLMNEVTTTTTT